MCVWVYIFLSEGICRSLSRARQQPEAMEIYRKTNWTTRTSAAGPEKTDTQRHRKCHIQHVDGTRQFSESSHNHQARQTDRTRQGRRRVGANFRAPNTNNGTPLSTSTHHAQPSAMGARIEFGWQLARNRRTREKQKREERDE